MSKTIMLVDDDVDDLEILEEAIREVDPGLVCKSFVYPKEALAAIVGTATTPPDFIFLDINMPLLTGDKLLEEIRKHKSLDHVVVALFSTSMPAAVAEALMEKGANYTFAKPVKMEEFVGMVRGIVS